MSHFLTRWSGSAVHPASSDADLVRRLVSFVYQQRVPDGGCVKFASHNGVVVVHGELPTPHAKWLCIECCRRVAGVMRVVDQLQVTAEHSTLPLVCDSPGDRDVGVARVRAALTDQRGWRSHKTAQNAAPMRRFVAGERLARRPAAA